MSSNAKAIDYIDDKHPEFPGVSFPELRKMVRRYRFEIILIMMIICGIITTFFYI